MVLKIICIVVTALACVFNAVFVPKRFLKAMRILKKGGIETPFSLESDRYAECKRALEKLELIELVSLGVCVAAAFLDGLHDKAVLTGVAIVCLVVCILTGFPLQYFCMKYARENDVHPQPRGYYKHGDGFFDEATITGCFWFPFFALIYQILLLL